VLLKLNLCDARAAVFSAAQVALHGDAFRSLIFHVNLPCDWSVDSNKLSTEAAHSAVLYP
jgi:hypothetical protein